MRCPRRRIAGVGLAITAAHAVLVALAWHGALMTRHEASPPQQMTLRWVATRPVLAPAATAAAVQKRLPPVHARPVPTATPAPLSPPAAAPERVSGAVFAMPTIGFGGPSPTRWLQPRSEAASPPMDMAWIARQVQEAERARMASTLECAATQEHCP